MEFDAKLKVEPSEFVDDKGKVIAYNRITITLKGVELSISIKEADKGLFNYLTGMNSAKK